MSKTRIPVLTVALGLLAVVPQATAGRTPIAVSPGGTDGFLEVESRCPTFSWSEVPGASGYELVVYRVDRDLLFSVSEDLHLADPTLQIRLPAAALSWTPAAAGCFERGERYVWFLRSNRPGGETEWSAGRLFEISSRVSAEEAEWALDVLEKYLEQAGGDRAVAAAAAAAAERFLVARSANRLDGGAASAGIPREITAPAPVPTEVWGIRAESDSDTLQSFALWGVALNNETGTAGVLGQTTSGTGLVDGVRGETASYDGVGVHGRSTRTDGHATGVEGYTAAAHGYGGLFAHGNSGGTALYARAADDSSADLVLGSTSPASNDGVLRSDPGDSSSDLRIESNDFLVLRLDRDNNSTVNGAVGGNLVSSSEAEAICDEAVEAHENDYHPLRVFVTSATFDGALGGITGANQKCQDRAGAAGLAGTFRAWISTSSTSASQNIDNHASRAYWLPNDVQVADNWADLTSCSGSCLDHAIDRDEFGNPVDGTKVWTATTSSGSWVGSGTPGDCASWTDEDEFEAGWTGLTNQTDNDWTDWGNQSCATPGRLYCFQN